MYIADTTNNVIRKVDTSSIITTVVGTGTAGNTNGAATSAKLDRPYKAVFDSTGTQACNNISIQSIYSQYVYR